MAVLPVKPVQKPVHMLRPRAGRMFRGRLPSPARRIPKNTSEGRSINRHCAPCSLAQTMAWYSGEYSAKGYKTVRIGESLVNAMTANGGLVSSLTMSSISPLKSEGLPPESDPAVFHPESLSDDRRRPATDDGYQNNSDVPSIGSTPYTLYKVQATGCRVSS